MNTEEQYDYLVYIGRFQPSHLAHIETIKIALQQSKNVIILIGSSFQPKTIKNPWSWQERAEMISNSLSHSEKLRVQFAPIADDAYNNQRWVTQVQKMVETLSTEGSHIGMIGHTKDDTSFYLKMFPQWKHVEVPNINDLHATDIRVALFEHSTDFFSKQVMPTLPKAIHEYLLAWKLKPIFEQLKYEYEFIQKYKSAWAVAPYEPIFVTVDAVVVQSGHVLLVKRRSAPGKGLWAIVGGFVNPNETLIDAMLRELREETKIKVPDPILRGNIKIQEVYDHPARSLRGRTITHAYGIELPPGGLPKVKGSDDAEKAQWIPITTIKEMRDQLFEDHYDIIFDMLGRL